MKLNILQDLKNHIPYPLFNSKPIPLSGINLKKLGIYQGQDQDSVRGGSKKRGISLCTIIKDWFG